MTVLGLKVRPDDLVSSVKARVSTIAMIPFPEQALMCSGKPLPDAARLDECALADGAFLDFVVCASDDIFADQLADIISFQSDPDLSATQLGALYFYKHGASANQALRILSCTWGEKFRDFLWRHPRFVLEKAASKGRVTLAPNSPSSPSRAKNPAADQNQAFVNLHAQLVNDRDIEQANLAMDRLCTLVPDLFFFHVERVVRGGSAGTGTAVAGSATAELLFVVRGLPTANLERTLPSLHCSTAAILQHKLVGLVGVESVWQAGETVRVQMQGQILVDLIFAPAEWSVSEGEAAQDRTWSQACQGGGDLEPCSRIRRAASAERTYMFLQALPERVKMTIRMLKWWRAKWQWSSPGTRPSDELLEYVAAWTSTESPPPDLCTALMNALGMLARFSERSLVPSSKALALAKKDCSGGTLPGSPSSGEQMFCVWNVEDMMSFDASEMMSFAQATQDSLFPAA